MDELGGEVFLFGDFFYLDFGMDVFKLGEGLVKVFLKIGIGCGGLVRKNEFCFNVVFFVSEWSIKGYKFFIIVFGVGECSGNCEIFGCNYDFLNSC